MSLANTLRNSKNIINEYSVYIGQPLDDILFTSLLKYTGYVLHLSKKEIQTAANSVKLYKGKILTRSVLQCIALRLSANLKFIRELVEVPYWEGNQSDAILFCKGISYSKEHKATSRSIIMHCIVVSGIAAGLQVNCRKSANYINYMMHKYMKVGKGDYEAEEIARTFFRCTIEELNNDLVDIKEITVTPFIKEVNKKTLQRRSDPLKCKTPNKLCWTCKKTVVECPNACKYSEQEKL